MREEVGEVGVGGDVDASEDVGEVLDRVHSAADGRDDEGVEERELLAGIFAVHEEEVLPPEGNSKVILPMSHFALRSGTHGIRRTERRSPFTTVRSAAVRRSSSARSRTTPQ